MFIGEAPGAQEDAEGIPFVGPSGKLLRSVFPAERAYFTNTIKCMSKPLIRHARACWPYLREEIDQVQPTQIVAVGEWASHVLSEHGIEHVKIDHPSNVLQGRKSVEEWRRVERKTRLPEIVPESERLDWGSVDPFAALAVDIETCSNNDRALMRKENTGLPVPWFPPSSLYCVGFAQGGKRWAWPVPDPSGAVQYLLSLPGPKIFHNALYDLLWLQQRGYEVRGDLHDTMWLLALRDEAGSRDLGVVGPYVYPWWTPDKAPLPELVFSYCANDALNTLALYQQETLRPYFQHELYRLYQRMCRRLVAMCLEGVPIFQDQWSRTIETCVVESQRYAASLQAVADIDWSSNDAVAAFLTKEKALPKKKTPSGKRLAVDEDALRRSRHPGAALLLQQRKVETLLRTFLLPPRGMARAHGVLSLNRAATGRTAMSRMNLQNIPKDTLTIGDGTLVERQTLNLRLLFGHPDFEWVKMDLVGAELLVIAVEARCQTLLEWFEMGKDVHKMMAGRILGKRPEDVTDDEKKKLGKVPNFTLCYGGGVKTLQAKAREEFGILLADDEAQMIVDEWFKVFPEIAVWHDLVKLQIQYRRSVTSPMGRVRTVPFLSKHDLNVATNAPIQGTVSDLLLMGLDAAYPWPGTLTNLVHDEIDLLIPKGTWDERRAAFRLMGTRMARVHPRFPLFMEIAVGDSWGGPWHEELRVP